MRILVVCTANVCRSPVAERLVARHLAEHGHDAVVRSAGTHGGQLSVHPDTVRAAAELGVDLEGHVSRLLTASLMANDGRDLVITMTREHLRHVVGLDPGAWTRTFTLKELVRRGAEVDVADGARGGAGLHDWLARLGAGRRASDLMRPDPLDDVMDPYGARYSAHVAMVRELNELCRRTAMILPLRRR